MSESSSACMGMSQSYGPNPGDRDTMIAAARMAIDAGAETDSKVRASWISDDTRARVTAFIDALARD